MFPGGGSAIDTVGGGALRIFGITQELIAVICNVTVEFACVTGCPGIGVLIGAPGSCD